MSAQERVSPRALRLRCNAAIPEVDLGTDIFAFRDDQEEVARLQVKACTVPLIYADGSGYSAKFVLPMKQLERSNRRPPQFYVLAVLRDEKWSDFLIVSWQRLQSYVGEATKFGSLNKANNDLEIIVEFRAKVECSGRDLTDCRNAWASLPPLRVTAKPQQLV